MHITFIYNSIYFCHCDIFPALFIPLTSWEEIKFLWTWLEWLDFQILCAFHSSDNQSNSHWIRGDKTNYRHSIWTIFPKIRLPVTARSLKKSIAQEKYIRLKRDQKFSILWLWIDDLDLRASVLFANLHCIPT